MTDIVGSTDHAAELGDSGWRELVQLHHERVRAALRRHGGREMDTAGDGFFAIFDAPASAVRCALEIVEEVGKLGLEIRAGVHVGEVEQIGRKVGGISVVIASRIMSVAGPSEVLVSSTVRDLVAGSRLTFDDRGSQELKGVPGEWHMYSVGRAESEATDPGGAATASELRASAVRRAGSRPIWQRRPRLVAAAVVGLAIVLVTTGLLVWKPWQAPALAGVEVDSIGVIDSGRNEFTGEITVETQPGGIAVADDYAWVTNTGANSVSQIEVATREVINRTIPVGRAPKGIAVANGSAWVANSGERTVSRIDIDSSRTIGAPIDVGNGPTAIVSYGDTIWVANTTDSTVVPIDATTGVVGEKVGVGAAPIALAVDADGLWVASEDAASISHLDPITGVVAEAPIQLSARPTAIALDPQAVWVTSVDGTVTRIERDTGRISATIPVGASLSGIAVSGSSIWTGDQNGIVYRLDATNLSSPPQPIATNTAVASMAIVNNDLWFAAQPSAVSRRGGILRIVETQSVNLGGRVGTDPLSFYYPLPPLIVDGLVGHRRVGGSAGVALLPDLATSLPQPANGGLNYTFQLRPDLLYSTGAPVLAADFRRGIERSFQVGPGDFVWGPVLFASVVGAEACTNATGTAVDVCDLSGGIVTDDRAGTVTFTLASPDPDFLLKLATPQAAPAPEGVSMRELVEGEFPGTGPYTVSTVTDHEVRLERNPHFQVWNAEVRPDGYPDEITFTVVADDATRIAMVVNDEADYTPYRGEWRTSPELFALTKTRYAGQWHVGSNGTIFATMNTGRPPFDNEEARQAVNFALDRGHMADLNGGPPDAAVTCQLLPPGFPGYKPSCPYTFSPDEGGRWKQADMQEAQRLIDESGTGGAEVVVGPTWPFFETQLEYLADVLKELGYRVTVVEEPDVEKIPGRMVSANITLNGWSADYMSPSSFLGLFKCGGDAVINHCDPAFDAAYEHALGLQVTDPPAAQAAWAALDQEGVESALLAPLYNAGGDFVSERVGNYQFSPTGVVLFDQMWVQ